ncbi:MAG: hypothetical protein ACLPZR_03240 [Solirubrobacteraceae bacterium]
MNCSDEGTEPRAGSEADAGVTGVAPGPGAGHDEDPAEDVRPGIYIVFDGPPSHESGRFIETENEKGEGVGPEGVNWNQREDGYWVLGPFLPVSEREQIRKTWGAAILAEVALRESANGAIAEGEGELARLRAQVDAVCILARKALDDGKDLPFEFDQPESWRMLRAVLDDEPREFTAAEP